ncbi:hypothetical protein GFS31_33950 [Leptolyngbya sp. BL0902]|nr:hypothetical protein GFS31_33950 [Leptolyngbya sp. BL0902]
MALTLNPSPTGRRTLNVLPAPLSSLGEGLGVRANPNRPSP